MAESKIIGYKKIFGFVLPDWVNENMIRNFGSGLLAMAAMMLVIIFVIWPNMDKIKTRETNLKSSKAALVDLQKSKSGLDRLKSDLSDEDQGRILAAMPQSYSPDVAIFALRRISSDTGVSIVSYSLPAGVLLDTSTAVQGPASQDMVGFLTFPIQITVAAPVDALLKFITAVESSLPFGVVSDLNLQEITKLSRTASDKTVQLALEIRYYQAILRKVNLNKLQSLTQDDLTLVKDLEKYNLLTISEGQTTNQLPVATGAGDIFGF